MSSDNDNCNKNIAPLTTNKYFVYRDKKYPFNHSFFKAISDYYRMNSREYKNNADVKLIYDEDENKINLSDDSIINFINFHQRVQLNLTNENVIQIDYLAKKYESHSLTELTQKYISEHENELILQFFLLYNDDNLINSCFQKYEELLITRLNNLIDDDNSVDKLLSFPIHFLYRLICDHLRSQKISKTKNSKIIDFKGGETSKKIFLFHIVNI